MRAGVHLRTGVRILDAGSVKAVVGRAIRDRLPAHADTVATHPPFALR